MKPLVCVHWIDIISTSDWTDPYDVNLPKFRTVGWVHSESPKFIKVCDTMDEEDKLFGVTAIPKGCVEKIEYLSLPASFQSKDEHNPRS
jgi:hypothetical protein